MLQMVRTTMTVAFAAMACSCSHLDLKGMFMPTGEGVEKRFEQSKEMNADLKNGYVQTQENYTFYVATDPHIDQTHRNLGAFNDAFRNDKGASFGVILGDCIDVKDNLPAYLEALSFSPEKHTCDHKIFHILGNHDLFFNGWVNFKELVGPSVFWFEVIFDGGKDLYISLDTATGSLGRKQTKWLNSFLQENRSNYRHCVILTHTNFFYTDNSQVSSGNMPMEESMALMDLFGKHNVALVLQGHDHYREDLTFDNVRYSILGAIHDNAIAPEYLKINVTSDGLNLDWQLIK